MGLSRKYKGVCGLLLRTGRSALRPQTQSMPSAEDNTQCPKLPGLLSCGLSVLPSP